ncbi:glucosaminidase domain-containing protein [Bacillus sp. FJAT-29953]|nr:glucosaminidase domain-containing protein [Bacillus sp. FJAT-29953]
MSYSPVSSEWFKNMALLSISKSLAGKGISSDASLFPTGDIFTNLLQAVLSSQTEQTSYVPVNTSSSLLSNNTAIFNDIKDYSHVLDSNTTLGFTDVSIDKLNSVLKGKLSNMGEFFVEAGRKHNINPNLLASIAVHETGNGKSRAANEKNNIAGMMGKNGLRQYESVAESIGDMARNLRQNYLDKGYDTIAKIGAKYAPVGAANDPTGLNNHWVKGVNNYFYSFLA